jgi:hypothetical protein
MTRTVSSRRRWFTALSAAVLIVLLLPASGRPEHVASAAVQEPFQCPPKVFWDLFDISTASPAVDDTAPRNDGKWVIGPQHEGVAVSFPGVAANDQASGLDVRLITAPRFAREFTLNKDGSYSYLPALGYTGSDTFRYQLTTSASACIGNVATVTIPAMGARLYDDTYTVLNDRVYTTPLVCSIDGCGVMRNDRAPTGAIDWFAQAPGSSDAAQVGQSLGISGGVVAATDTRGSFRFSPTPGFVGTTVFYYSTKHQSDIGTYFDTATDTYDAKVTINVIAPPGPAGFFTPVALDDSVETTEDTPLSISPASLLANDPGSELISRIATNPSHGSLHLDMCTTAEFAAALCFYVGQIEAISYAPAADFHGVDSFRYEALNRSPNASGVAAATVTIVVDPAVDDPDPLDDSFTASRGEPSILRVLDNDIDPDQRIDPSTVALEFQPDGGPAGQLSLVGDGTFRYTPDGSVQRKTFSYVVKDVDGAPFQANFTVDVLPNPAANDAYLADEDTLLDVPAASGVLTNDTGSGRPISGDSGLTLRDDGSFTYQPPPNFSGTKLLSYAHDGDNASIAITVRPAADAPGVVLNLSSCPSICPNDPDPDDRDDLSGGSIARLRGFVYDAERDTGSMTIDWGDGERTTQPYPCGFADVLCPLTHDQTWFVSILGSCAFVSCSDVLFFDLRHQYTDPPIGGGLRYTITVTATSTADGKTGSSTTRATLSDTDSDGVGNGFDNCAAVANVNQVDTDSDGDGDACDTDDDNDTVLDTVDDCVLIANTDQVDTDRDAAGNACDTDDDNDTVLDTADDCVLIANTDQANADGDEFGDVCDPDDDNDRIADTTDNCPFDVNLNQLDTDRDGAGDVCDADDDNDAKPDGTDNCPLIANAGQANFDGDALGDACDPNDDNDALPDSTDACDLQVPVRADIDNDGCTDTIAGLKTMVTNLPVDKKVKSPLLSTLGDAEKAFNQGKVTQAEARLTDFISQVQRSRTKGLTPAQADLLVNYATNVIAII